MNLPEMKGPGWADALQDAEPARLKAWERIQGDLEVLAPRPEQVFRAFEQDFAQVRVVIVGQDPYPTPELATGLAFAVPTATKVVPPSLRTILTELAADATEQGWSDADQSFRRATAARAPIIDPSLVGWARQGVLLLNSVLTCRQRESLSHEHVGWQQFTSAALDALCRRSLPPIAVLWGRHAQRVGAGRPWSHVVSAPHPSPLSAHRGFSGSRPFSTVNYALKAQGQEPIDWCTSR